MEEEVWAKDPAKRKAFEQYNQQIMAQANAMGPVKSTNAIRVVVPVVIHIIQPTSTPWVDDSQIYDALRILNRDFQKRNADTATVIARFRPIIGDPDFEFRLATVDPNGNCTNGITRTVSALSTAASDNVKDLISWNTRNYYNIWVVQTIASGAGGYAYRPGNSPGARYEGVVVLASQFGSIGLSQGGGNLAARTLTHETGHFFNLPHTWGGSNTPGIASNCNIDDGISDTPNTIGVTGQACPTTQAACAGDPSPVANVENYMDYADCERMFTIGQTNAMLAAAAAAAGGRSTLTSVANRTLTGVADPFTPRVCLPTAQINTGISRICQGGSIALSGMAMNQIAGAQVTYTWLTPGAASPTYSGASATAIYPTAGRFSVKLICTNSLGTDTAEVANIVSVQPSTPVIAQPLQEGFEDVAFPNTNPDTNTVWRQYYTNSTHRWVRDVSGSVGGEASLRLRNRAAPGNNITSFVSPVISTTGLTTQQRLWFKMAWAPRSAAAYSDEFKVFLSTDCGSSWALNPKTYNSSTTPPLSTVGTGVFRLGVFSPQPSEWRTESAIISTVRIRAGFQIKFEFKSGTSGNDLYLDDINIGNAAITDLGDNLNPGLALSIYPNPVSAETKIFFSTQTAQPVTISVTDVLGRNVATKTITSISTDETTVLLTDITGAELGAGVYTVKVQTGSKAVTQKITVIK